MKYKSLLAALLLAVGVFGAVAVSAQSVESLQQMINSLMQQIAALQGGATTGAATGATFSKDLTLGSRGDDVTNLQKFLEGKGFLTMPTGTAYGYFGQLTKKALAAYQAANAITPAAGYFGPKTRAAVNAAAVVVVPPVVTPGTTTTPTTPSTPTLSGTDGSIASVTNLSQYSNEEVGAGQKDVKVLGMEVEASNDGDIALKSMRVSFDPTGNTGSTRLNRYISSVSIWMGSTKIGSADVEDFSKDSNNVYSKTIALNSGVVVKSDSKERFYITVDAATVLDSGDISGTNDSWTVDVDNIRYEDGSGVITTDTASNGQNVGISFVTFSAAADTELKISLDSTSPKAGPVSVSDTANTDNVPLLVGKIQVKGTSGVLLDKLPITFVSVGSGVATITDTVTLKLGDEEYTETVPVATGLNGTVTFDNLDFKIDAGETVTFSVLADVNDIEAGTFDEGDTLTASLTESNRNTIDAENDEGDQLTASEKTGTATGKAQEFRTSGMTLTLVDTNGSAAAGTSANDDLGTFKIKFKVTAVGDAIYVPSLVAATTTTTGFNGRTLAIVDRAGTATTGGVSVALANLTDTTLTSAGNYMIEDGESETFELTATVQLPSAGSAGLFRAALGGVAWSLTDGYPADTLYTSNLDSFKTSYLGLN